MAAITFVLQTGRAALVGLRLNAERASWFGVGLCTAAGGVLGYQLLWAPVVAAPAIPPRPTAIPVRVEVAGEVARPGLYELPPTARLADAVRVAGGLTAEADDSRVNLAAHLSDGQRLVVPRQPYASNSRPTPSAPGLLASPRATPTPDAPVTSAADGAPPGRPTPFDDPAAAASPRSAARAPSAVPKVRPPLALYPTSTPRPTREPFPTRTQQPTHTPWPTRTPWPTHTVRPRYTPRPTAIATSSGAEAMATSYAADVKEYSAAFSELIEQVQSIARTPVAP